MNVKLKGLVALNLSNVICIAIILQLLDLFNDHPSPVQRVGNVSIVIFITQIIILTIFSNTLNTNQFMTKTSLSKSFIVYLVAVMVNYLILFLLGAPLLENFDLTLYLSICLASLSVLPYLLVQLPDKSKSHFFNKNVKLLDRIFISLVKTKDEVEFFFLLNLYFTYFGAWIGAFFLKLDWTVPWKEYPVTSLASALIFNLFSQIINLVILSNHLFSH